MSKHYACGRVFEVEDDTEPTFCESCGCELTEQEADDNVWLCNICYAEEMADREASK